MTGQEPTDAFNAVTSNSAEQYSDSSTSTSLILTNEALSHSSTFDEGLVEDYCLSISVSSTFHRTAHSYLSPADTCLLSNDGVLFYVHSTTISKFSPFTFIAVDGHLDEPKFRDAVIPVAVASAELDAILCIMYDLLPTTYASQTLENLIKSVDIMPNLSFSPQELILPKSPVHLLLLSFAPLHPMVIYTLAAHHHLHDLAVSTSTHLLAYPLQTITDQEAERMGSVYLFKLVKLQFRRFAALKEILLHPLFPHGPSKGCGFTEQRRLTRAWAHAVAQVVWDPRPDLSTYGLESSLCPLIEDVDCLIC